MKPVLEAGEYLLGAYRVQVTNWTQGSWAISDNWLRACVTNRRLIIYVESRRRAEIEEVIAPADILRVWNLCLGRRDGILVKLNDNRRLYLLVDWSQGGRLVRDIKEMMTPPMMPRIAPRLPHQ